MAVLLKLGVLCSGQGARGEVSWPSKVLAAACSRGKEGRRVVGRLERKELPLVPSRHLYGRSGDRYSPKAQVFTSWLVSPARTFRIWTVVVAPG